jgi:3-oxoacyl-[acyl-carrier-protein] synthase II
MNETAEVLLSAAGDPVVTDPVVTGIGLVLPWTDVPDEALEGAGRQFGADRAVDPQWFDARARLGPRGYKYLPPACQYLLLSTRRAVQDGGGLGHVPAHRRGTTVGTNNGLAQVFDAMDDTVVQGHADDLSPVTAPFFAINVLSTRLAAEHDVKGFQLTLTSPLTAGLEALEAGRRALTVGRCSLLVVAAMEHTLPGAAGMPADEQGSVALLIESRAGALAREARIHGGCRVRTTFLPPRAMSQAEGRDRAGRLVRAALAAVGAVPGEPVHTVFDGSAVSAAVAGALEAGFSAGSEVPAGTGCLAPMVLVAGLLAAGNGPAVVVTATAGGTVAVARIEPENRRGTC